MLIRRLIRHALRRPADDGDVGGFAAPDAPSAPTAPTEGAAPVEAAPAAPTTMAEAMWHRDEQGRFAPKPGDVAGAAAPAAGEPQAPAAAVVPEAAKPQEPAKPEDLTAMPEGLGPKAQQRFQALANGIKERDEKLAQASEALGYVQQTFQQHGVQREQFEQAVGVIGMLNRGDYRGALQVLDEQRRQIALQLGEPLPGVDALAEHADLRQAVDNLQITEAHALELARRRQAEQWQAQRQATVQQAEQQQREQAQQIAGAQAEVDKWWQSVAATDLDAPAIEKILLPRMGELLQGVPPQRWAGLLKQQYDLIKESVGSFRRPPPESTPSPLRSTGQAGAIGKPGSMHEAMFGPR